MSLTLNLKHIAVNIDNLDRLYSRVKSQGAPDFFSYSVDFKTLKKLEKKYSPYRNYILIGNGGSVTSFCGYYKALAEWKTDKNVSILTTMDPDVIHWLKKMYSNKDTLVIAISKSGNTMGVIENVLAFQEYPILCITSENSTLWEIAKKNKYEILNHPDIPGRFTGTSEVAYLPASLLGISVNEIDKHARRMYKSFKSINNDAFRFSAAVYLLSYNGYSEVFLPIYDTKLLGFSNLIIQLMHESVCKEGKGITFYCAEAPESQHHTNQRFFGGKKNVIGVFMTTKKPNHDIKIKVASKLQNIRLSSSTLKILNSKKLSSSLNSEFLGTFNDAVLHKIPVAELNIPFCDEKNIGQLIAFWHLVAIYSAILSNVDPFNQPQVEASKKISFELRKNS